MARITQQQADAVIGKMELVTPELASKWLGFNDSNRNIKKTGIDKYVKQMEKNEWRANGESIVFDDHNRLRQGQHRLMSVFLSGVAQYMMVVRNVPESECDIYDRGISRSVGDTLKIRGYSKTLSSNKVIGAINMLSGIEGQKQLSDDEIQDFIEEYQEQLIQLLGITKSNTKQDIGADVRGSIFLAVELKALMSGVDYEVIEAFIKGLVSGRVFSNEESSVLVLREDFLKEHIHVRGAQKDRRHAFFCISRALYDYVNKTPRTKTYKSTETYNDKKLFNYSFF